jgi:hypothetical protein
MDFAFISFCFVKKRLIESLVIGIVNLTISCFVFAVYTLFVVGNTQLLRGVNVASL